MLAATLLDVDEVCCAVSAAEFWRQSGEPYHFAVSRKLPAHKAPERAAVQKLGISHV
jgi:hypothetical protein